MLKPRARTELTHRIRYLGHAINGVVAHRGISTVYGYYACMRALWLMHSKYYVVFKLKIYAITIQIIQIAVGRTIPINRIFKFRRGKCKKIQLPPPDAFGLIVIVIEIEKVISEQHWVKLL